MLRNRVPLTKDDYSHITPFYKPPCIRKYLGTIVWRPGKITLLRDSRELYTTLECDVYDSLFLFTPIANL